MQQEVGAEFLIKFVAEYQIAFTSSLSTLISVKVKPGLFVFKWFTPFYIDLSCSTFIAIDHAAGAFAQLHTFYPGSGGEGKPGNGCQSANVRDVFSGKCCMSTCQAQHLNLFIATNRICKAHIYRWRGFETFAKVAAGRFH